MCLVFHVTLGVVFSKFSTSTHVWVVDHVRSQLISLGLDWCTHGGHILVQPIHPASVGSHVVCPCSSPSLPLLLWSSVCGLAYYARM